MNTPAAVTTTKVDAPATGKTDIRYDVAKARRGCRRWRLPRRRSDQWIAPCRDEAGRRRKLLVVLTSDGRVALVVPHGDVAVLDLLTVGRLRAVLREAVFALDDPDIELPRAYSVAIARASA